MRRFPVIILFALSPLLVRAMPSVNLGGGQVSGSSSGGSLAIGDPVGMCTANSVLFCDAASDLAQQNPGFTYDSTAEQFDIAVNAGADDVFRVSPGGVTVNGAAGNYDFVVNGATVPNLLLCDASADTVSVAGNAVLGDASADTVTSNAASWSYPNDTAVSLGGGVNGLNFDSNTLSIDATNDRVGIGTATPTTRVEVSGTVTVSGTAAPDVAITDAATGTFARARATSGAGTATQVVAGGAQAGATNAAGGNLVLSAGTATGTGTAIIQMETPITSGTTGTTDRTPVAQATLSGSAFAPCSNGNCATGAALVASTTWNNYFGVHGNRTVVVVSAANDQPIIIQKGNSPGAPSSIDLRSCTGTNFACSSYSGSTTVVAANALGVDAVNWGASLATTYPVIAWGDNATKSGKLRFCTAADCSTLGPEITLATDAAREEVYGVSLAVSALTNDVVGMVTFFENSTNTNYLTYFRCTDPPTCSSITTVAVSSGVYSVTGSKGFAPIAIATDGVSEYPVAFLNNGANGYLRFFRGADLDFSVITTAEASMGFNFSSDNMTRAVVDSNGEAVVVTKGYFGSALARCSPIACSAISNVRSLAGTNAGGEYGLYKQPNGYVGLLRRAGTSASALDLYSDVVNSGTYSTLTVGANPRGEGDVTNFDTMLFGVDTRSDGNITFSVFNNPLNPQFSIADFTSGTPAAVGLELGTSARQWANAHVLGDVYAGRDVVADRSVLSSAGALTRPAFYADGDANTGLYFPAADTMSVAAGGTQTCRITSVSFDIYNDVTLGHNNIGFCTLDGGSPSACVGTVPVGSLCSLGVIGSGTSNHGCKYAEAAGVITINCANGLTNDVSWVCFAPN